MSGDTAFWKSFVAGNVGGMLGQTVSYPFDTVRIRMQTDPALRGRSMFYTARSIMQVDGISALFRGIVGPVIGYGSINATAFSVNDASKALFCRFNDGPEGRKHENNKVLPTWQLVLCGMNAGAWSALVRAPIERVKCVMQTAETPDGKKRFSGTLHAASSIAQTQGVRGLFAGTSLTILREVIQFGMYYPFYEVVKRAALSDEDGLGPSWAWLVVPCVGGLAGAFQWLPPSYCVDVVKSRVQADTVKRYSGMIDCAALAYKSEGIRVFFRGLGPTLIRAFPLHAGVFAGYEATLLLLH